MCSCVIDEILQVDWNGKHHVTFYSPAFTTIDASPLIVDLYLDHGGSEVLVVVRRRR